MLPHSILMKTMQSKFCYYLLMTMPDIMFYRSKYTWLKGMKKFNTQDLVGPGCKHRHI